MHKPRQHNGESEDIHRDEREDDDKEPHEKISDSGDYLQHLLDYYQDVDNLTLEPRCVKC